MNRQHRAKRNAHYLVAFSVCVCMLLLLSFFKYDLQGVTMAASADMQTSASVTQVSQVKPFNYQITLLTIHMPQPMECMVSSAFELFDLHLSFEFWKLFFTIPSALSLAGLFIAFLCFGAIGGVFFIRKFTRFLVIPHSIHAPPRFAPK